jgi:5,10-methylenetetrahydromethanopterin reductase
VRFSVALAPSTAAVDHAARAENLGYSGVWVFDSPALTGDVWMLLALIANATEKVRLGPAVLVPSLRHVVTNATAIATLATLAPGRVAAVVGSGFSARLNLGQRPLPLDQVARYVDVMRRLLAGETCLWDGKRIRLMYPAQFGPSLPLEVPLLIGADGPRGRELARTIGDGLMASNPATASGGFEWSACMLSGTILDEDEDFGSARVIEAAGPLVAVAFHALYEGVRGGGRGVDTLPRGAEWLTMIEQYPEAERHLIVHEEHMVGIADRDRPFISSDAIRRLTATGTPTRMREHISRLGDTGVTEIVYYPVGPDIPRELDRFIEVAADAG